MWITFGKFWNILKLTGSRFSLHMRPTAVVEITKTNRYANLKKTNKCV